MKKINLGAMTTLTVLLVLCASLFSFTTRVSEVVSSRINFGGEGFEIYINDKLVLQQFGKEMNSVKSLQLDQSQSSGQLAIKYYHCGQAGKNRMISIKDEQDKILKEWHFTDAGKGDGKMCCSVKDIFALPKLKAGMKLNLYYASAELPNGRLLAIINTTNKNQAQP